MLYNEKVNFEVFYKQSFQKIYRFFYYKSVESSIVEDLTHDVYLRFYQKYSQNPLSEEESIKILYGIARNVYREWVRKSISEKKVSLIDNLDYGNESDEYTAESIESLIDSSNEEVESDFDQDLAEKMQSVKECFAELNDKVRQVLEYRFLEGKSRKEVAEILGINEKDVHTYQKRGVKYIKKMLEERGKSVPLNP